MSIMERKNILHGALAFTTFLFAIAWLPAPDLFDVACILLILLFVPIVLLPRSTDLRRDPLVRLGLLFFGYIVVSIIWHRMTLPDIFPPTTSDRRFLRVLYFIALAYTIVWNRWLSAWHLLLIAISGLLLYLAWTFDLAEWQAGWQGERIDFGIHNAQHTGVVFATCALGLGIFTPRFVAWGRGMPAMIRVLGLSVWAAVLLLSCWGVLVSQTRAVWLGLMITLLCLPVIFVFAHMLRGKPAFSLRKSALVGLSGIGLLALVAVWMDVPRIIGERLEAEVVTWEELKEIAAHESQDRSSIKDRVATWSAAVGWIAERPLMGWGGRGSRPLIDHSPLFSERFKETYNHLHSSYLQVVLEVGLIGAGFLLALITLVGRACIKAFQRGDMPLDVFLFGGLFFAFWLVVNIFESYIIFPTGTYVVAIVTGFLYSFCLISPTRPAERRGPALG